MAQARDIEGAKRFYRDTIAWTFEPMKMDWGTYWIASQATRSRRPVRAEEPRVRWRAE
jgi:predicted enzyme related to lactoylglutathione lyase